MLACQKLNFYQKFGTAMVQKECWAVVVAQLGERLPTPEDQGSKPTMCNLIKTIYLHLKRRTRRTRGREVTILTTTKNISILQNVRVFGGGRIDTVTKHFGACKNKLEPWCLVCILQQ